jgi:hypothetical protein
MWKITTAGQAQVSMEAAPISLNLLPTTTGYSNAQISSYDPRRRDFQDEAPLRLTLNARSSAAGQLRGTAGFGFWNHPFAPQENGLRVPQALWFFFASADSNMALAKGIAGHGWKAATFNAQRAAFYGLLPVALPGFALMRVQALYDRLWSIGQDALGVREALLPSDLLADWHQYSLSWERERVTFRVDGATVLESTHALPRGRLGFIAWIDNQYAIVTPQGQFGWGVVNPCPQQALLLDQIVLE